MSKVGAQIGQPDFGGDTSWMADAACRGMDPRLFFPGRGQAAAGEHKLAKAVCRACPVLKDCRQYALNASDPLVDGIWGGTSEKERKTLRAKKRRAVA